MVTMQERKEREFSTAHALSIIFMVILSGFKLNLGERILSNIFTSADTAGLRSIGIKKTSQRSREFRRNKQTARKNL